MYLRMRSLPEFRSLPLPVYSGLMGYWGRATWSPLYVELICATLTTVLVALSLACFGLLQRRLGDLREVESVLFIVALVWPVFVGLWLRVAMMRPRLHAFLRRTWVNGRAPICYVCGYDLRGTPGPTCSECGVEIPRLPPELQDSDN